MEDLGKVNSIQLYNLWKNLTVGMTTVIAMMTFSKLLPFYLSPVVSIICAAFLYVYIYNSKESRESSCMIVPYALMYCLLAYSFVTIGLNVVYAWGITTVPDELVFFTNPFIPSLILNPVAVVVMVIIMARRRRLHLCMDCRMRNGDSHERGVLGDIFESESQFQLKNLAIVFFVLSCVIWAYYITFYINININARDWYIFTWLTIIFFLLDELYFVARYYNLYLDMKENNEIITPDQLNDMTAKTYLRFYVICGNYVYVDPHSIEPKAVYKEVIDTPFVTKRTMNGIPADEVRRIIVKMTGYDNGELRFFFGRKSNDLSKHSLLRYFYFLDGDISDYQDMNVDGEWMDYEKIKYLYMHNPGKLAEISVADTSRLATIMVTEKTFDEQGFRKSRIRNYTPSFNLIDVRKSNLDFQDDKWIEVSLFNSDTPLFRIKRWWRKFRGNSKKDNSWQ
ncbi:MAG: hypothetical protein K2G52_04820 [Muribaculaceae bacterium]|nr:hypothetical protein [Muribaculaceae bacterium]